MALSVTDFEADAVGAGQFAQPAVTYQSGDVVLLLARNASSVGVDLDGVGEMTMIGTESDIYTLWGRVVTGNGTASFTYDSASCRLAVAATLGGVTGLPSIVASDFTTASSHPTNGELLTVNLNDGGQNATLFNVEAIVLTGDTVSITETSVPSDGHDTDSLVGVAVAGGIDVTDVDPPAYQWTYARTGSPGGADTNGFGWWKLSFPGTDPRTEPLGFRFIRRRRRVDVQELPYQVSSAMTGGVVPRKR